MDEEGGFGLGGRGWSSGALSWPPYGTGNGNGNGGGGGGGYSAGALLPPPSAEAPAAEAPALAERWRAALGLPEIEASPSPPPPLLRTGSALLLPHSYGSFDSLFAPLSMESPAPQPYFPPPPRMPPPVSGGFGPYSAAGFDYGQQVCNTPTAAAALSQLGGRRGGGGAPAAGAGTAAPTPHLPPADEPIATDVVCNGLLGQLLLKAPPLRIRVPATGEVLGPLDFERVAGVLSKKWRHTVHVPSTGQTLGEWLDARGLGHLTARGVPTPPAYAPPRAYAAGLHRPRPIPAHPTPGGAGVGRGVSKVSRRAGYGPDAWATGAELGSDDDEDEDETEDEDEEEEEEWRRRRRRAGGAAATASDSDDFSPSARRRAAARRAARAARFSRRPAGARGRSGGGSQSEEGSPRRRRRKAQAGPPGAKAGLASRIRMLPPPQPEDAATAWAYATEAPLHPRDFLRLAPLRRVHELRAAERAGPVALSRTLCGSGARALTASEAEAELASSPHERDIAAALAAAGAVPEALRLSDAPCAVRSSGGYRTVLSTHGVLAGAFYAEVALPRLPPGVAAARLGWAPDEIPLDGPVGSYAAATTGDAEAEPLCAGVGVRGATGQALQAGRPPAPLAQSGPTFGEGDTVGLYVFQPPCGREAALGAPRDVVALAQTSRRCGLFVAAPPHPAAAALVPGSAVAYRVNGGGWALVARDCMPRRPLHLAISLFTDSAAPADVHALALLNPGPHFAHPPPSADELADAVAEEARRGGDKDSDGDAIAAPALQLPAPRALCELGLGAEEWMTQREAAAAPAEPEGEQYNCNDGDDCVEGGSGEEEVVPRPCADAAKPANGHCDDGATAASAAPFTSASQILAAAAAAAAARLGLAAPPKPTSDEEM